MIDLQRFLYYHRAMNRKQIQLQYIFLLIFLVLLIFQLTYLLTQDILLTLVEKMILMSIQAISLYGYHYFDTSDSDFHKTLFLFYIFQLIIVLFLDHDFGRYVAFERISFYDYFQQNVNLKLFHTIKLFIHGYEKHIVSLETLLRNLLGNIVVFMPMAYFLPYFFKKLRKGLYFLMTMVMIVFIIECLQVILRLGSGDIDDLFLNVLGALGMYGILKCWYWKDRKE